MISFASSFVFAMFFLILGMMLKQLLDEGNILCRIIGHRWAYSVRDYTYLGKVNRLQKRCDRCGSGIIGISGMKEGEF